MLFNIGIYLKQKKVVFCTSNNILTHMDKQIQMHYKM